jgi:glycerol-1-phosphate dehydrogenase [NAD(P)+]
MAMTVAGSSRPASGGDHEIMHAIDQLFPGAGTHGELAGVGALFCTYLRGDERLFGMLSACLNRHELPRTPADLGLSQAEFTQAVLRAPATRPGRYTILERLDLDESSAAGQVHDFTAAVGSQPSGSQPSGSQP